MLNGRIYRAAFLPLLFALVIAGFSLTGRTAPLSSSLAPDAFEGGRAFAMLEALTKRFPERRPGSAGDQRLAVYVAQTLRSMGSTANGGFAVRTRSVQAQTIDGERTLTTVIAQRPGTTGGPPIVILAHRDAAGRRAPAELSGTVGLLEIARVLAASETQRPIVLVSTSGGSGGNAGAADFAAHAGELVGPIDAALVLGDLAGTGASGPQVASFSGSAGSAPALLQSTAEAAVAQQMGSLPTPPTPASGAGGAGGGSDFLAQLAHLAFPLAGGEQSALGAQGLPAVLVSVGGERPPAAGEPVSAARLEALGRAALATVYALDGGPAITGGLNTGLPIQHKTIPAWSLRVLVATLLLPALLVLLDGLARLRRRAVPVGRWVAWTVACGLPFALCAVFALALGALGAIPAPQPPVSPVALPFDAHALEATLATVFVLVLAWLQWPALMRRLGLSARPHGDGAVLGVLLVLGSVAVVAWILDPLTALLLVPALHVWLMLLSPVRSYSQGPASARPGTRKSIPALSLLALGVLPLVLLVAYYAHQLEVGPAGLVHTAVLLLAGGRVGLAGTLLWSAAAGCLAAALLVVLAFPTAAGDPGEPDGWPPEEHEPIVIRGPLSYAGPGSLGGTESALRR